MTNTSKMSVSVGASAYNEDANIQPFLESLCQQKGENISIDEIIIICDGCTDLTYQKAQKVDDPRIRLIQHTKRRGKNERINSLFNTFAGDVLVIFDVDIQLDQNNIVELLTSRIASNDDIGLVGANPQPLAPRNFIETISVNLFKARDVLRRSVTNGHNVFGIWGRGFAVSRALTQLVTCPVDVADDSFIYLTCITNNFRFVHEDKALIWFRSPQSISDYIKQGSRYLANQPSLKKYFSHDLIKKSYHVSLTHKMKILLYQLLKNPFAYVYSKYLHIKCLITRTKQISAHWNHVHTSKKL